MIIDIHPEVQSALAHHQPVVALESTIIAFGMPYPDNFLTALRVEETIRQAGAIPATIAIINGVCKVGLSKEELQLLATSQDVIKVSGRDLPYVIAKKKHGATTVASTMFLAKQAGIRVFATGGIGGVHRESLLTMDVSHDLQALASLDMVVVCAGPKAILDLEKTMEYLETMGVLVVGYRTNELPAFYTPHSGIILEYRVESPQEIASLLRTNEALQRKSAIVVVQPIEQKYALPENVVYPVIEQALAEAKNAHIAGKALTPYLLKAIQEKTTGESLSSNIQLILANARLAAKIAKAYVE